jgi:hypothetical protein
MGRGLILVTSSLSRFPPTPSLLTGASGDTEPKVPGGSSSVEGGKPDASSAPDGKNPGSWILSMMTM